MVVTPVRKRVTNGKDFDNNAIVEGAAPEALPQLGGATIFARQSYVECTGATASPPNANC